MERQLSEFYKLENTDLDPIITGIEYDSRNVKPGNLFFALPGFHTDGSLYIEDAISKGAKAIVHQADDLKSLEQKYGDVVFIKTDNARFAMSPVSASFYNNPSHQLLVIGVTGTEGKSTTVYLIWQLLTMLGKKAGFFSTVQLCTGGDVTWNPEHQTTPEAPVVQRLLREMLDNGCEFAVVEASSHGLSQKTNRLGNVNFCSAVFTNITHEHLEFHGSFEQYREDKANLFRALDRFTPPLNMKKNISGFMGSFGVINSDDRNARFFAKTTNQKTFFYSAAGRDGDIIIEAIESSGSGNWYTIYIPALKERIELRDKLPGAYNPGNVLAALLVVSNLLQLPIRDIAPFVKKLKPLRGRMTTIKNDLEIEIIVDYAHTPSSFNAILPPLRERLDKTGSKLISVFGSPGERDLQKRTMQGNIAAKYCDIIILADEDPRGEVPMDILEDIAVGIETKQDTFIDIIPEADQSRTVFTRGKNLFLIPDRPTAIRKALSLAKAGDIVIFLGKGHENSIIYKDFVMPYDEIAEVEKALSEIGHC